MNANGAANRGEVVGSQTEAKANAVTGSTQKCTTAAQPQKPSHAQSPSTHNCSSQEQSPQQVKISFKNHFIADNKRKRTTKAGFVNNILVEYNIIHLQVFNMKFFIIFL